MYAILMKGKHPTQMESELKENSILVANILSPLSSYVIHQYTSEIMSPEVKRAAANDGNGSDDGDSITLCAILSCEASTRMEQPEDACPSRSPRISPAAMNHSYFCFIIYGLSNGSKGCTQNQPSRPSNNIRLRSLLPAPRPTGC